jgi:serine/threonine-protein kinase RsbW
MARIRDFATDRAPRSRLAILLGQARVGKSELLRKSFDHLFHESGQVVPSYYSLKPDRLDAAAFARDFLSVFLAQLIAFRRSDASLFELAIEPVAVIARSAEADDHLWVKAIVDAFVQAAEAGDGTAMLRCAISAPSRAAQQTGLQPFVMLDDVHLLSEHWRNIRSSFGRPDRVDPSSIQLRYALLDSLASAAPDAFSPHFLLTGFERPMGELLPPDSQFFAMLDFIRVEPIAEEYFEKLIGDRAVERGVEISESVAELMSLQLKRDFFYSTAVLDGAVSAGVSLQTFVDFERVYSEQLTTGRIGGYLSSLIRDAARDKHSRIAALEALACISDTEHATSLDSVIDRMGLEPGDGENLLERLHAREILNLSHRFVGRSSDPVLVDYARDNHRSEVLCAPKPLAGFSFLAEKLKSAHQLMIGRYNRGFEKLLVDALTRFASQTVPACLFDEVAYEKRYRGLTFAQVSRSLSEEADRIALPQIVEVEDAGAGEHAGIAWRLFRATGFEAGIYDESNQAVWFAALINSTEPLDVESLRRIDERIEAALRGGRSKAQVVNWYIGKEGFSAAASQRIESVHALRSTYAQLEALSDYLSKLSSPDARNASEFELVIPIEDEAELIAARTAELIARAANFDGESINQIKTAVIEACINAAEHGQSPDGKIHQRFAISEDRIIITVSNKGRLFGSTNGHTSPVAGSQAKRVRGRGLNIIRGLMDEVHFQRTDDGTSLVMTRFLKRPENP